MIDEDLDDALGLEARRQATSKAALIRSFVRLQLADVLGDSDALVEMVGSDEYEPAPVDDVVYR